MRQVYRGLRIQNNCPGYLQPCAAPGFVLISTYTAASDKFWLGFQGATCHSFWDTAFDIGQRDYVPFLVPATSSN